MIFGLFRKKPKPAPETPTTTASESPVASADDASSTRPPEAAADHASEQAVAVSETSVVTESIAMTSLASEFAQPNSDTPAADIQDVASTSLAENARREAVPQTIPDTAASSAVQTIDSESQSTTAPSTESWSHEADSSAASVGTVDCATQADLSTAEAKLPESATVLVAASDVAPQQVVPASDEAEAYMTTAAADAPDVAQSAPVSLANESTSEPQTAENHAVPATPSAVSAPAKLSWAERLKQGLTKSRDQMAKSLASVFGGGKIDEDLYEELETVLLTADAGIEATEKLMESVRQRVSLKGLKDGAELKVALKESLLELIQPLQAPLVLPDTPKGQPFVIMLAGINGAGKTTSIGKLAKYFQAQGKSVLLAAGDTFRAAAREQLQEWGKRNDVTVISQASGDSAAVCFDAVEAAKARGIDIVLADTAGRLPTQLHLMEEIKKVKRVLQKAMPDAPHEIILVLDANIGQNALRQVAAFDEALGLTGLILTKLDGTAKGGILAALAEKHPIPVRYIGVGEGIDDLRPFAAAEFVDALLD